MLSRFFGSDPVKDISAQLEAFCPEPELWPQVKAYLNQGKKAKDIKAVNALRAYLDLREHLGSRAAFKNGAPLSYDYLAAPVEQFFAGYEGQEHLDCEACREWAYFCLAADHVLANAYSAKLMESKLRKKAVKQVSELCAQIKDEYFEPLQQAEASEPEMPQEESDQAKAA